MADPRPEDDPEPGPEIADASLLFGVPPTPPSGAGAGPAPVADAADGYAIEGPEPEPAPESVQAPVAPIPRAGRPRDEARAPARAKGRAEARSSGVDEVWSRGAEWAANLTGLGVGLLTAAILLYATFNVDALMVWVVVLAGCLVALAALAYPIFITLERPVRVTPEQAIKDYYGALSHLVPHTKRMWLLLSTEGRVSHAFRTYPEFRAYWRETFAGWKKSAGASGPLNPFDVTVDDFKSGKSAGEVEIEATYTARVIRRGQPGGPPVATHRVSLRLVRGPDKMWYLEKGTLG